MTTPLISATLIYDGTGDPIVPDQLLPKPRDGMSDLQLITAAKQLQGAPLERLCEIAGRSCYDSLGRGRDSAGYHQHILEVKHLSTVEHANVTIEWPCEHPGWAQALGTIFLNRPSLFVRIFDRIIPVHGDLNGKQQWFVRATLNLRHLLEWKTVGRGWDYLGAEIARLVHPLAPQIIPKPTAGSLPSDMVSAIVEPEIDEEKWVTMLLTGSRGFSHELVRHGDWTAISQRSTRYVDESESPWVRHPLADTYFQATDEAIGDGGMLAQQGIYQAMVPRLETWLIARGVDKTTARKQARGAARGYLGNALYTEVVFSANLAQWRRMLRQRLNAAADAEIRQVFAGVLRELQRSRYASSFAGWTTAPSPDGIGEVLVEP
jgi:thymidylate synthase ThyX